MSLGETSFDKWYVPDCLMNSMIPLLEKKNLNMDIVYCDYYSFTYRKDLKCIGGNYVLPHNTPIYLREEYLNSLNNTYKYIEFMPIKNCRDSPICTNKACDNKISIYRYITDDDYLAWKVLKDTINHGEIFVCAIDIYYMPYHGYYQKKHAIHYIDIVSYDDNNCKVEIVDIYESTNSNYCGSISYKELEKGRSSSNPMNDDMFGISGVDIKSLWVEVSVSENFSKYIDERQIIIGSLEKMKNTLNQMNIYFGFEGMRQWIGDLESNGLMNGDVGGITQSFMYELRVACISMQRSRYRFRNFIHNMKLAISYEIRIELSNSLEYISQLWFRLSNLFYRYWAKPSEKTFSRILQNLSELLTYDMRIYEMLNSLILNI